MPPTFELNILIASDGELFPYTREAACHAHVRDILEDVLNRVDPDTWIADDDIVDRAKKEAAEIQRRLDNDDLAGAWEIYRHGLNDGETSMVRGEDGWRWEGHQCVMPEVKP